MEELKREYNRYLESFKRGFKKMEESSEEEKEKILEKLTDMQNNKMFELLQQIGEYTAEEQENGFEVKDIVVAKKIEKVDMFANIGREMEIAKMFAKSTIVPEQYQGKPENVLVAIGMANSMGLELHTVMQNLSIIRGKTSWSGSFCKRLIERTGRYKNLKPIYVGEKGQDSEGCYIEAVEVETGEKVQGVTVDMNMAKAEKWTSNPKWRNLTQLMLTYRAYSFFARIYTPEALNGIQTDDEVVDVSLANNSNIPAPVEYEEDVLKGEIL